MNNKGVTLIELLIVIVVIGIISAFAVPAVSNYLEGAEKQAVYQQAVAIRNAADTYCSYEASCTTTQQITWGMIKDDVNGIDDAIYTEDDDTVVATLSSGSWQVTLEDFTNNNEWEWTVTADPIDATASSVARDTD